MGEKKATKVTGMLGLSKHGVRKGGKIENGACDAQQGGGEGGDCRCEYGGWEDAHVEILPRSERSCEHQPGCIPDRHFSGGLGHVFQEYCVVLG